eukprot:4534894-Prymnesium_polylepis.1
MFTPSCSSVSSRSEASEAAARWSALNPLAFAFSSRFRCTARHPEWSASSAQPVHGSGSCSLDLHDRCHEQRA